MQAADFPPTRLDVLKTLAGDLCRRGSGHRIGVYAFAGFPMTQAPFTTDTTALLDLVGGLAYESIDHDPKSGGTHIGDALLVAADDLQKIRVAGRDQVLVLITDGENTGGADPLLAARLLRERGIRTYTVGIGQERAVPVVVHGKPFITTDDKPLVTRLDDRQLREIARLAGGSYTRADGASVLGRIFDDIARMEHRPFVRRDVRVERPLAPLVALLLLGLLASWLSLDAFRLRSPIR
jgi:Ca-activated chloride channel family protein